MTARYDNVQKDEPRNGCRFGCVSLIQYTHDVGYGDKGCYNPDSTLPGGEPSLHTVGRAVDLAPGDGDARDFAGYIDLLVQRAYPLGIQQVLYRGRGWSLVNPSWHDLTPPTDPHMDHAHVELTLESAGSLSYGMIHNILAPPAPPTPTKPPEEPMEHIILYHDPAYTNVFAIFPSGEVIHISGELGVYFTKECGAVEVTAEVTNPQTFISLAHKAGLAEDHLVPAV